jgi:hypothetical protein
MHQRFAVPHEFAALWALLVSRYREYLPEIRMESDSFVALPEEAAAIFLELEEMASYSTNKYRVSRRAAI